ncbi:signal transduction histidine kinase (STHK), LytS [Coleofasciculus sp. FACHB-542]|uniref:signal transduction histidine kinase (STHK), LytS n=1 Tax=Cyanophyceae TaxID=3028117 RepID=UPI001687798D|nr:signal transduction histidine kinase (STHK), LytS [Coleofasciculus sp. FACHB-542]MBD2088058.1 signal transduction histidine kinase (STHK), LytS [Coleofasciculus sp. FACHB-542]
MVLTQPKRAFGVFSSLQDAEGAIQELKAGGFPMNQVSAINKEPEQVSPPPTSKAQEGTTLGAIAGGAAGGVLGLALGLGTIAAIPVLGPISIIGVAATALATTLTSGVIGATAGGLLGALTGYGIPDEQAAIYNDRIHHGDYFLIVEGTEAEVRQAEAILNRWNVQELRIYDAAASPPPSINEMPL